MDTVEILSRLIAFDTTSANSNLAMIDFIDEFLQVRGFHTIRLPSANPLKAGLYAEIGPKGDGVLLSAHTDVVPALRQNWTRPPFELTIEGERLYGRGTTDMKGFLATMLDAASKAQKLSSEGKLKAPLKLVFSYDEEIGCVGIAEMMPALAPLIGKPTLCFVGEPTEMQLGIGHKGKIGADARFYGEGGHSALAPNFVNALHLAADFIQGLRALQTEIAESGAKDSAFSVPYSTVHVGRLEGGRALNIVPDYAELRFEIRYLDRDEGEAIFAKVKTLAETISAQYQAQSRSAKIEIDIFNAYPNLASKQDEQWIESTLAQLGAQNSTKLAYGTEAGFFDALGIPTVVIGPGFMEGQGHKPDEFIKRADLQASEAMLERVLAYLTDALA